MRSTTISQYLIETQDKNDTVEVICILCDGKHGNNTLCQMSDDCMEVV